MENTGANIETPAQSGIPSTTLFDLGDARKPSLRDRRRQETESLKKQYGIFTDCCRGGGEWLALCMPECIAYLAGHDLTEDEKENGVILMFGYCRLLDEAGLVEEGHATEWLAVTTLVARLIVSNTSVSGPCPSSLDYENKNQLSGG